jgi:hypothetical protein
MEMCTFSNDRVQGVFPNMGIVEGAVAESRMCFQIWKVRLCQKSQNRGLLMTNVGCPVSGSRVHFQILRSPGRQQLTWMLTAIHHLIFLLLYSYFSFFASPHFPYLEMHPGP